MTRAYMVAIFSVDDVDQSGLDQLVQLTEQGIRSSMAMEEAYNGLDPEDQNVEFLGVTVSRIGIPEPPVS